MKANHMKQITLSVPEEKYEFFVELLQNLDFVSIENFDIPEAHKNLVRERIKTSSKEKLIKWDDVKDSFKRNK
jgi:hypothetical protein